MDVGSATSPSAYSYQASLQSSAQPAILQSLSQAYSGSDASNPQGSGDPLAAVAGSSSLAPLVSGITAMSQAIQSGQTGDAGNAGAAADTGVEGLSDATFGGLDNNSASALLASMADGSDTSGLQGFDAAVAGGVTVALASYQVSQGYAVSAPAAQTSPSSTPTSTVDGGADSGTSDQAAMQAAGVVAPPDANSNAGLQQAAAAANASSLSLLA
jgi:hypothetical protein